MIISSVSLNDNGVFGQDGISPNDLLHVFSSVANDLGTQVMNAAQRLQGDTSPTALAELQFLNGNYQNAITLCSNMTKSIIDSEKSIIQNVGT